MNAALRAKLRITDGREPEPNAAVLDIQSVENTDAHL